MHEDILHQLGLKITTITAGLIGGLISLTYQKSIKWYKALFVIIIGGITAGYVTPLLTSILSLGTNLENSMAFILGLLGMRLTTAIVSLLEKISKDPSEFIRKIRGK